MRALQMLVVVVVWSIVPILKRVVLDYMKYPDSLDAVASPVRTFVAINSLGCTIAAVALAVPTGPRQFIDRLPSEGWAALLAGVMLSTVAGILLVELLRSDNPGQIMVYLNAGTNVLTYVMGALLYGQLTWQGSAGVLLIAGGIGLIKSV